MQHDTASAETHLRVELAPLRGLWTGVERDLVAMGISSVAELRGRSPDALLAQYCDQTARPHDPVLRSCFVSVVHYSETGRPEPWWRIMRAEAEPQRLSIATSLLRGGS